MWFERLTGFSEKSPENVRNNIEIKGGIMVSKVNGKSFHYGDLKVPSLEELRNRVTRTESAKDKIKVSELVGDVQAFHKNPQNTGAIFQAASQFNLLEMVNPYITPESGIDIYEQDYTQGPACAIACGAGTIYRNYFAPVNGEVGQSAYNQIDCLKDIGIALKNAELDLWSMKNGYALATEEGLKHISQYLRQLDESEYERLKGKLRVGIQWDTEVTLEELGHKVTQIYCSALPVAYSQHSHELWEKFARLILEGTYEATLLTGMLNYQKTGNNQVYLTLVGGGAFGNSMSWILESQDSAIRKYENTPLDVKIVSYGHSNEQVKRFTDSYK